MSSITIRNLVPVQELDRKAMSAIRGGTGFGSPDIKIFVPINVSQANNMAQTTSVLNNSIIGAGAVIPGLSVNPSQWAMNSLSLPASSFPVHPA
jgi:hypothetical protein